MTIKNEAYKGYQTKRFAFFWSSIFIYFVPYIIATACLLPFVKTTEAKKWALGLAVLVINFLPFLMGIFKGFRARFPFVNVISFVFVILANFFLSDLFQNYVYTLLTIESVALAGSIVACVLWFFHRKYKRKAQTVADVLKSGILDGAGTSDSGGNSNNADEESEE